MPCKEVWEKEGVREKIRELKENKDKVVVIADFDRTLTYAFHKGKKIPSLISLLRDKEEYLDEKYRSEAKALFEHYHKIEMNTKLSIEEKAKFMKEWWTKHYELLKRKGLRREDVDRVVMSEELRLREGVKEFIELCNRNGIPFIIVSSNGLGKYAIERFLEREGVRGVEVVATELEWDEDGKLKEIKEPIIYLFSKYVLDLESIEGIKDKIKGREYGIIIGDNEEDSKVGEKNIKYRLSICYYPYKDGGDNLMKRYYDIVVLEDCDFSVPLNVLKQVIE